MLRLGLCCKFCEQPIKFRETTAAAAGRLSREESLAKVARLCLANAEALQAALEYCSTHGIGCFRVGSQILPLKTHPVHGYTMDELPAGAAIVARYRGCGRFARRHGIRLCFHPDQFVVLNSPRSEVVAASIRELDYQAEVSQWIGADVINIHAGGAFGDKPAALARFAENYRRLPQRVRRRLTLENDDKLFSPRDLLPLCHELAIPLVYDVHHHRCLADGLSVEEATALAEKTWNREPLFHLSSPLEGWQGPKPARHHDYIAIDDFPFDWLGRDITVEVEAKAKELAIARLQRDLTQLATASDLRAEALTARPGSRATSSPPREATS